MSKRIWRTLVFLVLSNAIIASAAIQTSSPEERPSKVQAGAGELIIELDRGSIAHFTLDATTVSHVLVRVGDRELSADLRSCILPRSVHAAGMRLIREDLREDEHRTDALTLLFDAGSESDRVFGQFPRVQLTWLDGELVEALITRRTATNQGFSSPLCSPDVRRHARRQAILSHRPSWSSAPVTMEAISVWE